MSVYVYIYLCVYIYINNLGISVNGYKHKCICIRNIGDLQKIDNSKMEKISEK